MDFLWHLPAADPGGWVQTSKCDYIDNVGMWPWLLLVSPRILGGSEANLLLRSELQGVSSAAMLRAVKMITMRGPWA